MTTLIYSPRHHAVYADTRQTTSEIDTGKIVAQENVCKGEAVDAYVWVGHTQYHVTMACTAGNVRASDRMIRSIQNNESREGSLMPQSWLHYREDFTVLLLTDTGECIEIDEHLKPRLITRTYSVGSGSGKLPLNVFGAVAPKLAVQMAACFDQYTGGYVECHSMGATRRLDVARTTFSDMAAYVATAMTIAVVVPVAVLWSPIIITRLIRKCLKAKAKAKK